ncbi:MAG: hypothetical protein KatS3mg009_3147 [Acidimicrobiia bacterium]|nr:MAG: hypothetical protein KatS3mg009_3147 [Acidimicrobiia bacterium]
MAEDGGTHDFAPFSATVVATGRRWVVVLAGELDLATRPAMQAVLGPAGRGEAVELVLDVSRLTFVDAGAVRSWCDLAGVLRGRGGGLVLRGASRVVRKVAELVGLDRVALVEGPRPPGGDAARGGSRHGPQARARDEEG